MMRFRRKRGSFSRFRRGKSLYEMQEVSFSRQAIVVPGGASASLPSTDLFLITHPRLEWSPDQPGVGATPHVLPVAKGLVVKGIHHRHLVSSVADFNENPTATALGYVTVHAAILRLPTDVQMTPLEIPNLYRPDVDNSPIGPVSVPNKYRTLWRGLEHIRVFDGSLAFGFGSSPDDRREFDDTSFIRTKTGVTLSMEQGLFLLVQCLSPFIAGFDVTLGLDTFLALGVKPMTRGTTYP